MMEGSEPWQKMWLECFVHEGRPVINSMHDISMSLTIQLMPVINNMLPCMTLTLTTCHAWYLKQNNIVESVFRPG